MSRQLLVHSEGRSDLHHVRGPTGVGGSQADGIAVPGLPPAALRLLPLPAGMVVAAAAPGLRVAGHAVSPGACRLLRAGEQAAFRGVYLELPDEVPGATTRVAAAFLLRSAVESRGVTAGPHLVVLTGPDAGERISLGTAVVLGRGNGATYRIRDPGASRRHARVSLGPGGATVEDLGAKNRLRVNGVPIERGPTALRPGDLLTMGGTELAYEDPSRPRPAPPPARAAGLGHHGGRHGTRPPGRPLLAAALLATAAAVLGAISFSRF